MNALSDEKGSFAAVSPPAFSALKSWY